MYKYILGHTRIYSTATTYMEDYKRKKGKDKRKNTWNKYGKNTTRGLRHKLEQCLQVGTKDISKPPSGSKTK